jgi:signal transduction histidine kinase
VNRLLARAAAASPRTQDLAIALALTAFNVASLIPQNRQLSLPYAAYALVVLQTIPLTWRRKWPVAVWWACGIPRTIYDNLGIPFAPLPIAPMIAYYTVMDRGSVRMRWMTTILTVIGVTRAAFLPGHDTSQELFVSTLEFAVAGIAGLISGTRRANLLQMQARAEAAEAAEAEKDREVAMAAANERARIARELHDVVAHHVSLIAVQSQAAASLLPGRPAEAGKAVEIIGQTAREALAELRRLLGVLRGPVDPARIPAPPPTAPSPSVSELGDVLSQVRQAGIAVHLKVEGSPARLAPGVDLAAYRIVQEALTNTVRHSGADQAAVTVAYEPGFVTVSVIDTGPAAVPIARRDEPRASAGFGLAGIAERVASCGGNLTLGPALTGGFAVSARLPTP